MPKRNNPRHEDFAWPEPSFLDVTGTRRDDRLRGTPGDDSFDIRQGGADTVIAGAGNDAVIAGARFDAADRIDGGAGRDSVLLDGDYAGLTLAANTIRNIETIYLNPGHTYSLVLHDRNVGAGDRLTIYTYEGARAIIDGAAETSASLVMLGFTLNDVLRGGGGSDYLLPGGGSDLLDGGGGYDRISFEVDNFVDIQIDLRRTDRQNTGAGFVKLSNVEDAVGAQTDDTLVGNTGSNWLSGGIGGSDELYGFGGDDLLTIGAGDNATVHYIVDGGTGADTLDFSDLVGATYGVQLNLINPGELNTQHGFLTVTNVERFQGTDLYDVFTGDDAANVFYGRAGEDRLQGRGGNDILYGDKTIERATGADPARPFVVANTAVGMRDILIGGDGNDVLVGGDGGDVLAGDAGRDRFVYEKVTDSVPTATDDIYEIDADDRIDLSAIDANPYKAGNQAFHLGATSGRTGDILIAFDTDSQTTKVSIFIDRDATPDMMIEFIDMFANLTAASFIL